MSAHSDEKITRADLLRAGAIGVGGMTLLSTVAGCAKDRLVTADATPRTDPRLVKYREGHRFKPGFHWLRGLCSDGTSIWVAADQSVARFSAKGELQAVQSVGGIGICTAMTPSGRLFAATDDRVVPLDGGARWSSLGPRARIVSMAANDKSVFVADAGNRVIHRFDADGRPAAEFGRPTSDYPGLIVPSPFIGLALHPSGDLIVTNIGRHRVERHTPDGRLIEAVGEAGMDMDQFCGCCNPTHVTVLPDGDMVTSEKGLPRVKVISPDGSLKCVVAGPEQFHPQTQGLATAVVGNCVAILDPWEGAIRVFGPI